LSATLAADRAFPAAVAELGPFGRFNITMSSDANIPEEEVVITLPRAQALVLFEFLSRFSDDHKLEIKDQAEERVLWNVCCDLERVLVEPLRSDYDLLLRRARETVRDKMD
jgi:hypothetical protein